MQAQVSIEFTSTNAPFHLGLTVPWGSAGEGEGHGHLNPHFSPPCPNEFPCRKTHLSPL